MQSAMSTVHETYIRTFDEAFQLSLRDDADLLELLKFLSDRHSETEVSRDDLQGLRHATHSLNDLPTVVRDYLRACETYFGSSTQMGVSTPLRKLLEKLKKKDRRTGLSLLEIEQRAPRSIRKSLKSEVAEGLASTKSDLRRTWPTVVERYHAARLQLLHP